MPTTHCARIPEENQRFYKLPSGILSSKSKNGIAERCGRRQKEELKEGIYEGSFVLCAQMVFLRSAIVPLVPTTVWGITRDSLQTPT